MKNRTLLILVAVTVLAISGAWYAIKMEKTATTVKNQETALIPDIKEFVDHIRRIEITKKDQVTTLVYDNDEWFVKQKYQYKADLAKIRRLVSFLGLSSLREKKTTNKARYEKIGLDEDSAVNIMIFTDNDTPVTDLYIGSRMYQLDSTYVRRGGEGQTWLASGSIDLDTKPEKWLDRSLFSIHDDRVRSVIIEHPENDTVVVKREDKQQENFAVGNDIPPGEKIASQYTVNNIASVMKDIEFEDVIPVDNVTFDESKTVITRLQTFDGLEIVARLIIKDGQKLASFNALFKESLVKQDHANQEKLDKKTDLKPVSSKNNILEESTKINEKISRWVFALSDYKYSLLTKKLDDLTEEENKKDE